MDYKSCFFIGHRETDERVLSRLLETVERLIVEENVGYFYVGHHGGFDRLAAELAQLPLGARQRAAGLFLVGAAVAASGHKGRSDSDYRNFQ